VSPRLLVVSDTLDGGLGAIARNHAEWFLRRRWHVGLATSGNGSGDRGCLRYRIEIPNSIRDARSMVRAARALRLAIHAFRPDIVHCHGLRSFALAALAGRRAAVTLHGSGSLLGEFAGFSALRSLGVRLVPLFALRAVTVAPHSDLAGRGLRWEFLPHASPRLQELDRLPFSDEQLPTFLWLGRLDAGKRPEIFIEALAEVSRTRAVRGLIVGAGSEEARLRRLAAQRRAPAEFFGLQHDVERFLSRAWAVVLFSRFEGLPLAIEEAMWAGRMVIASPLPAVEWLVGDTGRFASNLDEAVDALSAATDRAEADRLGEAAARRIRALLSPEMPWAQIERAYHTICGDRVR
jgi:glycosyltransferase involved in cell wall biosynthesis